MNKEQNMLTTYLNHPFQQLVFNQCIDMFSNAYDVDIEIINKMQECVNCSEYKAFFNIVSTFDDEQRYYITTVLTLSTDKNQYCVFLRRYEHFANRPTVTMHRISIVMFVIALLLAWVYQPNAYTFMWYFSIALLAFPGYVSYKNMRNTCNLTPWEEKINPALMCF